MGKPFWGEKMIKLPKTTNGTMAKMYPKQCVINSIHTFLKWTWNSVPVLHGTFFCWCNATVSFCFRFISRNYSQECNKKQNFWTFHKTMFLVVSLPLWMRTICTYGIRLNVGNSGMWTKKWSKQQIKSSSIKSLRPQAKEGNTNNKKQLCSSWISYCQYRNSDADTICFVLFCRFFCPVKFTFSS